MEGYLGEENLPTQDGTPYEGFDREAWALEYIGGLGQIDGAHHKAWVLDQVARILKGTPVIISLARWSNEQTEYRYTTGPPSAEYLEWVEEQKHCDGDEYDYDVGIAP